MLPFFWSRIVTGTWVKSSSHWKENYYTGPSDLVLDNLFCIPLLSNKKTTPNLELCFSKILRKIEVFLFMLIKITVCMKNEYVTRKVVHKH